MNTSFIFASIGVFLIVILLLVVILLVAKKFLSPSGNVNIEINGDKTIKDFYGRPLGYYKKGRNVTTDFYGRVVASGDQLTMLLNSGK